MIRFLIITSTYESYFEDPNVCLAHTGLFLTCASLVFWGFDMRVTAAGEEVFVFSSVLFLRLLVGALISDCHMSLGNTCDYIIICWHSLKVGVFLTVWHVKQHDTVF